MDGGHGSEGTIESIFSVFFEVNIEIEVRFSGKDGFSFIFFFKLCSSWELKLRLLVDWTTDRSIVIFGRFVWGDIGADSF